MQINLPSQSFTGDSQEADPPPPPRVLSWTLAETRRGGRGDLLFNAAGELCCSASSAMFQPMECKKRATRRQRARGRKRTNECKLKDESVCLS